MKFLYFIFAIYTLSLSLMPCGDGSDCDDVAKHEQSGQHQEETCAPFCICACCGTVTSIAQTIYFTFITSPIANHLTSFNDGEPLKVSSSIWQPPQLV